MSVITNAARWSVAMGATSLLLFTTPAKADDCSKLPAPIYGLGGSATKPILGKVGAALAAASPPQTIVYQAPGACLGINAILAGTKITGTASYWDTAGKEQSCTLALTGDEVQFANMGNSATLCPGVAELPADVADIEGPINTFTMIVPKASTQLSISGAGAYFTFGFGAAGNVSPWIDDTQIFRRDSNSAAQLFIALAAGLPAEKFKGIDTKTNAGTITAVATTKKIEEAIGLVSGELADANRSTVRILAYQHYGQTCGYWPDSTQTSFDKRNVRTGQYWIWSPIHFFTKIDPTTKKPKYPAAYTLSHYFSGQEKPPSTVDMLSLEIAAGTIPQCAMEVSRKGDLGPLASFAPAEPCGCYFDKQATGSTTCAACTTDTTCPSGAPHCRFGFCEVN